MDFAKLLANTLVSSGDLPSGSRHKAQPAPITSLDTWLQAWSIYAEVLALDRPKLAPSYQSFI